MSRIDVIVVEIYLPRYGVVRKVTKGVAPVTKLTSV